MIELSILKQDGKLAARRPKDGDIIELSTSKRRGGKFTAHRPKRLAI